MDIRAALAAPFVFLIVLIFLLQRWNGRRRQRKGKRLGFYPSVAVMGTALLTLQKLMQPHMEQVTEQRLQEPAEDDDESGPDDPVAHLHRQARKLRRGEIESLTTFIPLGGRFTEAAAIKPAPASLAAAETAEQSRPG